MDQLERWHMARIKLTAPKVLGFVCPPDKNQAFLWDSSVKGLAVRATPKGAPTYIFQSRFQNSTIRMRIGFPNAWTLEDAREKAREYQRQIDEGKDPREVKAAITASDIARRASKRQEDITVGVAWADYCERRRPHWGELHYRDHINKAKLGGTPSNRRGGKNQVTSAGPLASLMGIKLINLNQQAIESWAASEGTTRPTSARLAWRLLGVFLTWCSEQPEYQRLVPEKNPAKTKRTKESLGKATAKSDVLQREQLESWFNNVKQIQNPMIAASIQVMLLTGARVNEVLDLKWEDINDRWKGMQLRDKIEGTREIPKTPYVSYLLANLPRRNEWVFSSPTSERGRLSVPNSAHTRACKAAGIDGLTLQGLRRSFSTLTEWIETPSGIVAQIQGHKPSATAEKHYKVRPLELLRIHHTKIEAWILEQAQISFDPSILETRLHLAKA